MAHKQPFSFIDALLIFAIVGLTVLLVYVIWEPGQILAKMEDYKWESRARMSALRTAEIQYFSAKQRYTADIDSLIGFSTDSLNPVLRDSLFAKLYLTGFKFDSLRNSPISLSPYGIEIVDTTEVLRYSIHCPDGFGYISSLTDPDEHNKASWEQ